MATHAFAVPILPGKTEDLKKYIREMNGPRRDEYRKSSEKTGLDIEQMWLQHTPEGDMLVVRWETDNPTRVIEQGFHSNDTFDQWFREKVIVECLGMNPSEPPPAFPEMISDYQSQRIGKKTYEETRKR
jgi:hypothetical protein